MMTQGTNTAMAADRADAAAACRHDSTRVYGALDDHCLLCGVDGYWHDGHAHSTVHPAGHYLITLTCPIGPEGA